MHLHTILSLESTCIIIPHHFISQMCNKTFLQYQPAILHPPCVDPTWNGPKISWNHICTRCMPGLVALCPGYPCCCSLLFAFLSFFFLRGLLLELCQVMFLGRLGCSSQRPFKFMECQKTKHLVRKIPKKTSETSNT